MINGNDVTLICACDEMGGIGKDNQIPWDIPADFKHFQSITKNTTCIMGKNTYVELVSMKQSRMGTKFNPHLPILKDRTTIVLSSSLPLTDNCYVVPSWIEAMRLTAWLDQPISILGGSLIYKLSVPYLDQAYITQVPGNYNCTEFVPIDSINYELSRSTQYDEIIDPNLGAIPIIKRTK